MRLRACILAIAVVTPLRAFAQTPPPAAPPVVPEAAPPPPAVVVTPPEPTPPPPAPAAVAAAPMAPAAPAAGPKFTWGGLIDTYYMYLFNPVDGVNSLVGTVAPRQFDTNTNSATLALSAVTLNASMDPVAFQLDLGYGTVGSIINGANGVVVPSAMQSTTGTSGVQGNFIVLQAYGTITVLPQLTLDFGKFYTTAGAEVVPANKNWLYSRSILFFNIPLLHTGARANFKVNDMLSLQASLVNGWNDDPDVNAWKTVGLSASITASPMVAITATTYIGKEAPQGAATETPGDLRILADVVAALTLSDKLGVNINFDYVKAPVNVAADYFVGVSAMARFVISDHLNVAGRGEWARGHLGDVNSDIMEGTVMLGIDVGKNFEIRPEFRIDHNGQSLQFSNTGSTNQVTGTIAALTYF
jgi:hypothetical protein